MQQKLIIFLFSLFSLGFFNSSAQQYRFIYIQTENHQPFFVKLDKKLYSSSVTGYLIIAKLTDGTYPLKIGFPKSEWSEQNITCSIDKKDLGFLLKNFGDKGWGLFNLQTLEVTMSGNEVALKSDNNTHAEADDFSAKLSKVVNDPRIIEKVSKPVPAGSNPNIEALINKDSSIAHVDDQVKTVVVSRSVVSRNIIRQTVDGTEIIYTDAVNGTIDTISILIPTDTTTAINSEKNKDAITENQQVIVEEKSVVQEKKEITDSVGVEGLKTEKIKEEKFLEIELPKTKSTEYKGADSSINKENVVFSTSDTTSVLAPATPAMINSNCINTATDDDFLKLRKKMAAAKNDDDMITFAKKAFKSKCFKTNQIKNLSVLFLNDQGKYQFFDAAYPYVSDSHNFSVLESLLTDPYFISRFKVMIHH